MSNSIPSWLKEHCDRLSANDVDLVNLNLNIRRLDPDSMCVFSQALQNNHVIQFLNLTSSLMHHPEGLVPLSTRVLPHHVSLRVLHLSYNNLSDVTSLGIALRTNLSLRELYLNYNDIRDDGAAYLADGIRSHPSLQTLNLNSNNVGDKGACAFAEAIGTGDTRMVSLSLRSNCIGKTGASAFLRYLESNARIERIALEKNGSISNGLMQQIHHLTQANINGRYLLKQKTNDVPPGLWAHVLSHVRGDPSMIYFFLTSKPELVSNMN